MREVFMENKRIFDSEMEERDYREEILSVIRGEATDAELREALDTYHDNDVAGALEELSGEERERLLDAIGSEAAADILPYSEDAGEYLSELGSEDAADIIERMDADEALEVLESLDEKVKREVLGLIEGEVKEEILLRLYTDQPWTFHCQFRP